MKMIKITSLLILLTALIFIFPGKTANAQQNGITPDDLIYLVNTIRTANGLPALRVDSILMRTAQDTAETMAAQNLTWHIGKTGERIQAAGYGTGHNVWATENFAMSWGDYSLAEIQQEWADATHMIPMVNPSYCDIGAGVAAAADGTVYYIVHAAYTSAGACGSYQSPVIEENEPEPFDPTEMAELDTENVIDYVVKSGDSLWQIAIENDTTTAIIKQLNELDSDAIYIGQKLKLPSPDRLTPTVTVTSRIPTATRLAAATTSPTAVMEQPTETPESAMNNSPTPGVTEAAATGEEKIQPPPEANPNNAAIWQILAGIEFIALLIITLFFWQPWIQKQPVIKDMSE